MNGSFTIPSFIFLYTHTFAIIQIFVSHIHTVEYKMFYIDYHYLSANFGGHKAYHLDGKNLS